MPPLTIFDHAFSAILIVGLTIVATLKWRKVRQRLRENPDRYRVPEYRQTMLLQWGLVVALLTLWLWQERPLPQLGLGSPLTWGTLIAAALVTPLVILLTVQLQRIRASAKAQARLRVSPGLASVKEILPHKPREMRWFAALSVTAGICEEILYRGYLVWYLQHAMPIWPAMIVSAALFGTAHAYQGLRGIPKTGMVGFVMGLLYLLAGSLWVPMLLHALVDINGGLTGLAVFGRRDGNASGAAPDEAPAVLAPAQTDSGSTTDQSASLRAA